MTYLKYDKKQVLIPADPPETTTGVLDVDFSQIETPEPEDLMRRPNVCRFKS
jgi:hypothetical protein